MEKMKVKGSIKAVDVRTGKVVFERHNMFVQTGLNEIAKLVAGQSEATIPAYVAAGTSSTAPSLADAALKGTELGRKALSVVSVTDGSIKYSATFAPGEATGAWEEVGIFSASSGGIMFSRAVTGTYTKGTLDEIQIFWTYDFSDSSAA